MPATQEMPQVCRRCTGRGTHYLTCPTLRLPLGRWLREVTVTVRAAKR